MRSLWHIAGSLKTGIVLLTLLTVASLIGVVFPQGLEATRYLHRWGTVAGTIILTAQLDHLFSSVWFRALLFLFSVNVLFCTIIRLKVSLRNFASVRYLQEEQILAFPEHLTTEKTVAAELLCEKTTTLFRKKHFRVSIKRDGDCFLFDARRGALRDIGSALLHFCLLPLLVGGLIAVLTGFSYTQRLGVGETASVKNRSFKVRCDAFTLERNERGAVKDYKSGLTLLDSTGNVLVSKVIEVNHPLIYRGIKFYQSSYSVDSRKIDSIKLVITGPDIGAIGKSVTLSPGETRKLTGSEVAITAEEFIPDFMYDTKAKKAASRSNEHDNPALRVILCKGDDTLFAGWIFQKFGMMHHEDDRYSVAFMSYAVRQSTGLLVKENPGGPLIWFGIFGMTLGVLLVFWIPRRRFWVSVKGLENGGSRVVVGGTIGKDDPEARSHWDAIKEALNS